MSAAGAATRRRPHPAPRRRGARIRRGNPSLGVRVLPAKVDDRGDAPMLLLTILAAANLAIAGLFSLVAFLAE